MLIEFRVENYRSIAEQQSLSLIASRERGLPEHTFPAPIVAGRALKYALLFGPNGGGKSNVLAAVHVLKLLVVNGAARLEEGDDLPAEPFLLDERFAVGATKFGVSFVAPFAEKEGVGFAVRQVLFDYEVEFTKQRVEREVLRAWPNGREQVWFSRNRQDVDHGRKLRDMARIIAATRSNTLLLSVAAHWNHSQLKQVADWFRTELHVLGDEVPAAASGLLRRPRGLRPGVVPAPFTAVQAFEDPEFHGQVAQWLRAADVGIEEFRVRAEAPTDSAAESTERQSNEAQQAVAPATLLRIETTHRARGSEGLIEWPLEAESRGTRDLFDIVGPWLDVLSRNFVVFVDEKFNTLHPALTRQLLAAIVGTHASRAQFVVVTHDVSLLDHRSVRRDQIWVAAKQEGATQVYSLADFEHTPRQGEALLKNYLLGKYGGIPMLSPMVGMKQSTSRAGAANGRQ